MQRLLLFLAISSIPLSGLCQQSSPPAPAPLTESEKRLILIQLYELQGCRAQVLTYEDFFRRDKEQDAREQQNWQRSLELERQATALAQKERDLALDKAGFYESAFRSVTKKRGFSCYLKKVFSLGIARCQ